MKYYVKIEQVYNSTPHFKIIETKFIISENFLLNARIVEIGSLHDVKNIIVNDWENGDFGNKPDLYKWLNRPYKSGNVNKNCKVL